MFDICVFDPDLSLFKHLLGRLSFCLLLREQVSSVCVCVLELAQHARLLLMSVPEFNHKTTNILAEERDSRHTRLSRKRQIRSVQSIGSPLTSVGGLKTAFENYYWFSLL